MIIKLLSLLILTKVHAAEILETNLSVRALGMGNAYTAVVTGKDSLFYNPAGLARTEGVTLTVVDPYVGINGREVYDRVKTGLDANNWASNVSDYYGARVWLGAGGKAALTFPGFAFAAYDNLELGAYLNNPAYPNLDIRYFNDIGFATGIGVQVLPTVHFGIVGQRIERYGGAFPIGVSTLASLSQQDILDQISNKGVGYSATAGLIIGAPTPAFPRISAAWKNIGQTTFTKTTGSRAPAPMKNDVTAGFAFDIDLPLIKITPSFDFKHLTDNDEQIGKKVHMGIEVGLPLLALRGGFSQGYYTAGMGYNLPFLTIDAATYGVELGAYPGQKEDRRYILQATMEIDFSGAFGFLKFGGGDSGKSFSKPNPYLKQRR